MLIHCEYLVDFVDKNFYLQNSSFIAIFPCRRLSMEIITSHSDYPPYARTILQLFAKPELVKEHYGYMPEQFEMKNAKNRVLKKAIRDARNGKYNMFTVEWHAGNGDLMFFVIYDHPPKNSGSAFTEGVIVGKGLKTIPFKNVMEGKDAVDTALALYHYAKSFCSYNCTAGL